MLKLAFLFLLSLTQGCYNVWGRADLLAPHDCDIVTDSYHYDMVKAAADKWEAVGCFTITVSIGNPIEAPHNIYFVDEIGEFDGADGSMSILKGMDDHRTEAVIFHEMGHHQGLSHTQNEDDVMYRHNENTILTNNDIEQVRSICRLNGFEM